VKPVQDHPVLYIVVPCYNEQEVLPLTSGLFVDELKGLVGKGKVSERSRVLFVNDGSGDGTWELISQLAQKGPWIEGISLSRNRGHQNALLAGLMEAKERGDIAISIDADGQDDIGAMDEMVDKYLDGCDIVYGVRSSRDTDTAFKRGTARRYYKLLSDMGVEVVYDHADYRLMDKRALEALSQFEEVNLYLRGMVPLVGFTSTCVYYERHERMAGSSHYPLKKMVSLAVNGITSLSIRPIRIIATIGLVISLLSFIGVIWAVVVALTGGAVPGWASIVAIVCFMGGIQLLSLGVIGEYVGKTYLEAKRRPRFIVSERTYEDEDEEGEEGEGTKHEGGVDDGE
jgi:glycosyltransferase involved in cell wall biosynthesis